MRIDSSGNVGIGTTSADGTLHVHSGSAGTITAAASANNLVVENNGPVGLSLLFDDAASNAYGNIYWGNETDGSADGRITYFGSTYVTAADRQNMEFRTAGTARMRIDSSGRLLVGLTASDGALSQKLQVEATDSSAGLSAHRASADAGGPYITLSSSRGASIGDDTIVQDGDSLGYLFWTGADGTDRASHAAYIEGFVNGTPGENDMPGAIRFATTSDGAATATERMRINSSGNVGIGTASPSAKLEVALNSNADATALVSNSSTGTSARSNFRLTSDSAQLDMYATSAAYTGVTGWGDSGIISTSSGTSGGLLFNVQASAPIRFMQGATNERMRIDSSGNLLVGTTNSLPADNSVEGIALSPQYDGGIIQVSRTGQPGLTVNRRTSDGDIQLFKKNGTTVGSIGVSSSDNLYIAANTADHAGLLFGTHTIYPMEAATLTGGTIDLGASTTKFKDLYLSGGVYVGGAVAANKLDDYEEGTWTPTLDNAAGDLSATNLAFNASGKYTKIGRMVYVTGVVSSSGTITGTASSPVTIKDLPFTVSGNSVYGGVFVDDSSSYNKPSVRITSGEFQGSNTIITLKKDGTDDETNFLTSDLSSSGNGNRFYISGFYMV
jgi:hypothetical protein